MGKNEVHEPPPCECEWVAVEKDVVLRRGIKCLIEITKIKVCEKGGEECGEGETRKEYRWVRCGTVA